MESGDAVKSRFSLEVSINPFIDEGGWIRMLTRDNGVIKPEFNGHLSDSHFADKFRMKSFGVSNSLTTMNTEDSWYIDDVKTSLGLFFYQGVYPDYKNPNYRHMHDESLLNKNMFLANFFNGKTPTGTAWSEAYNEGYIYFKGIVKTYGSWSSFYYGCSTRKNIGEEISFRTGGGVHHTGEFIHGNCNDYKQETDHSITSLVKWNNRRVIWIKV